MHIPVAGNGNKQLVPDIPYSSVWYVMISFEQAITLHLNNNFRAADCVILTLYLSLSIFVCEWVSEWVSEWVGRVSEWVVSKWVGEWVSG